MKSEIKRGLKDFLLPPRVDSRNSSRAPAVIEPPNELQISIINLES